MFETVKAYVSQVKSIFLLKKVGQYFLEYVQDISPDLLFRGAILTLETSLWKCNSSMIMFLYFDMLINSYLIEDKWI